MRRYIQLIVHGTNLIVVVLLASALAACGTKVSSGTSIPADHAVTITVRDNVFDPASVTVPAGKPVKVTFVNEGKNPHEVEIKGLISETKLQPGQSRSFTITPEKNTYKMYDEAYEDQGMVGQFIGE